MLAIRNQWVHFEPYDPYRPWWAFGLACGCMLSAVALALRERSQPYAYGSVVLAVLASAFLATGLLGAVALWWGGAVAIGAWIFRPASTFHARHPVATTVMVGGSS